MQMQNELDIQAYFESKGIQIKRRSGDELITDCFFCGDTKAHLYIHKLTGQYCCHKCHSKGNLPTLMAHFGDKPSYNLLENKRKIVATYDYTDESGNLLFQVVRYDPKDFRQRRPDGKGGWI